MRPIVKFVLAFKEATVNLAILVNMHMLLEVTTSVAVGEMETATSALVESRLIDTVQEETLAVETSLLEVFEATSPIEM
jgi:hypothetical protein